MPWPPVSPVWGHAIEEVVGIPWAEKGCCKKEAHMKALRIGMQVVHTYLYRNG